MVRNRKCLGETTQIVIPAWKYGTACNYFVFSLRQLCGFRPEMSIEAREKNENSSWLEITTARGCSLIYLVNLTA